jgi:hypothetical protein
MAGMEGGLFFFWRAMMGHDTNFFYIACFCDLGGLPACLPLLSFLGDTLACRQDI